ncbi:MAG: hypothetical protein ACOY32_10210 [Thermodesulfobacteriota bacterium]
MHQNDDLQRLAVVVEDLLGNFNRLKMENTELSRTLEEREAKIREMEAEIALLQSEREDVSQKVAGILSTIHDFEKSVVSDAKVETVETESPRRAETVAHLFSMES